MKNDDKDHAFNNFISQQLLHIERNKLHIGTSIAWRQKHVELAGVLAREALKGLLILYGGALVVLPTFKAFNSDLSGADLKFPVACFITSIVCVIITYLMGFLSYSASALGWRSEEQLWDNILNVAATDENRETRSAVIEKAGKEAEQHWRRGDLFEKAAIALIIISLVVFSLGAYLGVLSFFPV